MATLDVSSVLLDPLFLDALVCQRHSETINAFGENEITSTDTPFYGVVTTKDGEWLQREEDAGRSGEVVMVHTVFRLLGIRKGGQPDTVLWQGRPYTVKRIYDNSRYGAGFMGAELEAQETLGKDGL